MTNATGMEVLGPLDAGGKKRKLRWRLVRAGFDDGDRGLAQSLSLNISSNLEGPPIAQGQAFTDRLSECTVRGLS